MIGRFCVSVIFIEFFSLTYCPDLEEDGGLGNSIKWIHLVSLPKIRHSDSPTTQSTPLANKIIPLDTPKREHKFSGF